MNQEPIDFDDIETQIALQEFLAFMDLILPESTDQKGTKNERARN
jgi:hypothetical protein